MEGRRGEGEEGRKVCDAHIGANVTSQLVRLFSADPLTGKDHQGQKSLELVQSIYIVSVCVCVCVCVCVKAVCRLLLRVTIQHAHYAVTASRQ